jgi:hypothetical protein
MRKRLELVCERAVRFGVAHQVADLGRIRASAAHQRLAVLHSHRCQLDELWMTRNSRAMTPELTRDDLELTRDDSGLARDVLDLTREIAHLTRKVADLTREPMPYVAGE